jgi:hypothetical protein
MNSMEINWKKSRKIFLLIASIVLFSIGDADSRNSTLITSQDSVALVKLVRQYLQWAETSYEKRNSGDFWPATPNASDSLYRGIDWTVQKQNVKVLEKSKLFTEGFVQNYEKIAAHIDTGLKSGKMTWHAGDMPEFGPGGGEANPWCNCQDHPDNYLDKVAISDLQVKNDKADFNWTWGDNGLYHVKARKVDGRWRVDYLQGFDRKEY